MLSRLSWLLAPVVAAALRLQPASLARAARSQLRAPRPVCAQRALDAGTAWRFALELQTPGAQAETVTATIRLEADQGYEPPQGTVRVETCLPEGALFASGTRWALSEDPDDPKDGLWIWGMFKEPLYPFMLLSLKLAADCAGLEKGTELFLQGEHRRDPIVGVKLGEGTVCQREPLTLPGGADAGSAFEPVPCGSYRLLE